jgi:hypothetical protein
MALHGAQTLHKRSERRTFSDCREGYIDGLSRGISSLEMSSMKGLSMEISVSEEVQAQLDQVKEWMESKIGREVTYDDVILQILKNFQSVLYPEDLGSA